MKVFVFFLSLAIMVSLLLKKNTNPEYNDIIHSSFDNKSTYNQAYLLSNKLIIPIPVVEDGTMSYIQEYINSPGSNIHANAKKYIPDIESIIEESIKTQSLFFAHNYYFSIGGKNICLINTNNKIIPPGLRAIAIHHEMEHCHQQATANTFDTGESFMDALFEESYADLVSIASLPNSSTLASKITKERESLFCSSKTRKSAIYLTSYFIKSEEYLDLLKTKRTKSINEIRKISRSIILAKYSSSDFNLYIKNACI